MLEIHDAHFDGIGYRPGVDLGSLARGWDVHLHQALPVIAHLQTVAINAEFRDALVFGAISLAARVFWTVVRARKYRCNYRYM